MTDSNAPMPLSELRAKWPAISDVMIEHGPGWFGVLDKMLRAMERAGFVPLVDKITQIKEKFGTIRVYVAFDSTIEGGVDRIERIYKVMHEADNSARSCETCGQPSHLMVTNGWIMSRCKGHTPPDAKTLKEHFKP
jgi:hypothetical protein